MARRIDTQRGAFRGHGRRFAAMVATAACAGASALADDGNFDLERCVALALERNPQVVNARLDVRIAETTVRQAWGLVLPNVSADAAYKRLDEVQSFTFGDMAYRMGSLDTYNVNSGVSQLLYSGGKVRSALKAGDLSRRKARCALLRVQSDIVREVRTQFAAILLAQREIEVRTEALQQIRGIQKQMEDKLAAGKAAEYDVIAARVRAANEAPRLYAASNALQTAVSDLRRLLALDAEGFSARGELVLTPVRGDSGDWRARARQDNPRLRELAAVVDLRAQDVAYTRAQACPEIKASANYGGANSYGFGSGGDDWEWHWNAGLSLHWDIWNGGQTRAATAEKELVLAQARTAWDAAAREVDVDVNQAWMALELAARTAAAGADTVALARKGLAIAGERTRVVLATTLDLLYAQVALSEATLTRIAALRDHMNAVTRLEHAGGAIARRLEQSHE